MPRHRRFLSISQARVLRTLSPFANQTFLDRDLHNSKVFVQTANRHHVRNEPFSGTRSSFCANVPLVYCNCIHSIRVLSLPP